MTALIVVDLTPTNPEKLSTYSTEAAKTLIAYKGEFLSKGSIEVLHGDSEFNTKVIIQFPNKDSALKWYNSPEYQKIIPTRNEGMKSQFHLIG